MFNFKNSIIGILLIILFTSSLMISGCEKETDTKAKLVEFMKAYEDYCSYPYSGTILVAKGDQIILNEGYGMADYTNNIPNTADTVFPIGSITKSFTAVAIMQLNEEGLLKLNDPISKYTGFVIDDETITIHQLLTHTSGLPREGKYVGKDDVTLEEHAEYISQSNLLFKPGEDYEYSNAGYILLAYIIEEISDDTYIEYMTKNILEPLEMNQTYFGMDESYGEDQAIGYRLLKDNPIELSIYNFSNIIGSGNIYSTTEDLFKYDRSFYNKKLLSKKSIDQIFTPHWGQLSNGFAYSWEISERYGHRKISHGGAIGGGGYTSLMIKYPEEDYVLIFLINNSETIALNAVSETLEAIIFNKDYVLPVELKDFQVDSNLLESYAGDYEFEEGFTVSITYKDDKLYSTADDGNTYELLPLNKNTFFFEDHQLIKVQFEKDQEDNNTTLKFHNRTSYYEGILVE